MNREHVGAQQRRRRLHTLRAARESRRRAAGRARSDGQQLDAHELAQPALEPVAIDGRVLMTRNDDPHARKFERGSEDADIEMHGPNSLPLSNDGL